MNIEEAYERQIDENVIKTGVENDTYYIDLTECSYDHLIKINPPENFKNNIYIKDESTEQISILDNKNYEFWAEKGNIYYLELSN